MKPYSLPKQGETIWHLALMTDVWELRNSLLSTSASLMLKTHKTFSFLNIYLLLFFYSLDKWMSNELSGIQKAHTFTWAHTHILLLTDMPLSQPLILIHCDITLRLESSTSPLLPQTPLISFEPVEARNVVTQSKQLLWTDQCSALSLTYTYTSSKSHIHFCHIHI